MVLGNDQTEIFYWPFNTPGLEAVNDRIWVKQWQRTAVLPVSISPAGEAFKKWCQEYQTQFGDHLYEYMARNPSSAPFVNCLLYKTVGGESSEEVMEAPDAIHYQAGIDNLPCLDLEMGFRVNDDFSNVVVAWNYVIDQVKAISFCSLIFQELVNNVPLVSYLHLNTLIQPILSIFLPCVNMIAIRICQPWRVPIQLDARDAICQVLDDADVCCLRYRP